MTAASGRLRAAPRGLLALAAPLLGAAACGPEEGATPWAERPWTERTIDAARGGRAAVADVDGDGHPDVVLHEWRSAEGADGSLAWYSGRDGARHELAQAQFFGDALVVEDLDHDGDVDVVAPLGSYGHAELALFLQGADGWTRGPRLIVDREGELKDLEAVDLDRDGHLDLVARAKHATVLFFGAADGTWTERRLETRPREGMALGDLDADGDVDLVLNGFWLETPDDPRAAPFLEHVFDPAWFSDDTGMWQDFSVMVDTADMDRDGALDIVVGHSEKPGVEVAWYGRAEGGWLRHPLGVVDWCHTLAAEDFDGDGWPDVLVAETRRSETAALRVLRSRAGASFEPVVLFQGPSYKAAVGDADGDGDLDVVGSTSWVDGPVRVFVNPLHPMSMDRWRRHALAELPCRAPFVDAADVDGDGDLDLVAGPSWFENPGRVAGRWEEHRIGAPLGSAAVVADLDGDGVVDVFGTQGEGSAADRRLAFARGLGGGRFEVRGDLPTGPPADFLQGRAVVPHGDGLALLLSWHAGEGGLQRVIVPADPSHDPWTVDEASPHTRNEDLETWDVDRDGDPDVVLGTLWLRRDGERYAPFELGTVADLAPTRHAPGGVVGTDRLARADLDRDGRIDLVAGCEGAREILWFQAPADPTGPWTRRVLAQVPGEGYSLDAADMDRDGDMDVVVGEHRGERNRLLILENAAGDGSRFVAHEVDRGRGDIDHHDGTLPVDLDGDGDLDIVSIGWTHPRLWVFENLARRR